MNYLKVFGGLFAPAIVFLASLMAVFAIVIGSMRGGMKGMDYFGLILSLVSMIGSFGVPAITAMNFIKPDNELKKISATIVVVVGALATISTIYTLWKSINALIIVTLFAAVLILISGLFQMRDDA